MHVKVVYIYLHTFHFFVCKENLIYCKIIGALPKNLIHSETKLGNKKTPGDHSKQAAKNSFIRVTDTKIFHYFLFATFILVNKLLSQSHNPFVFDALH